MKLFFVAIVLIVFSGCDFFGRDQDRELAYRIEKDRQEAEQTERIEKSEAMRVYLNAKCKLVEEKLLSVNKELDVLHKDAAELEEETAQMIADSDRGESRYEVQLLKILKNKKINDLAVKYLSSGFGLQAEEFIEKVREARFEERRFNEALKKSQELYDEASKSSEGWVGASREQRDTEIRRLENEIRMIEQRRKSTRREMISSDSYRREWMNKMNDYEEEIRRKRLQIDYLRNPDVNRNIETRAANRVQDLQRMAVRTKEERDFNIHRRLKPKVTVTEVADTIAAKTIEKLRDELKRRIGDKELERKKLKEKTDIAKEILIAIPVSDLGELNRLRSKADNEL